jgi:triacylglycerol lipase
MRDFQAFTTRHDLKNALALARAAELAYADPARIDSVASSWGLDRCQPLVAKETQAFVASDRDVVLVAFRGTEEKVQDVVTDARFGLVGGALGGKVHQGFRDALRDIRAQVEQTVQTFQDEHQAVWVTGHSLGAALATLLAAEWVDAGRPFNGLYTFGSPRVGDGTFARHFNAEAKEKTFRYVNGQDIVTRVPPRSLGYRDVGTVRYFDHDGRLHEDPAAWNQFLESVEVSFTGFASLAKSAFKDHSISLYVERIQAAIDDPRKTERRDLVDEVTSRLRDIRKLFG